jgi:UDP-N-acetyl-D-mannosaminuronic acid transferase (WecB/TagA/CpsF family)
VLLAAAPAPRFASAPAKRGAGAAARAPDWMQRGGAEWLHRLLCDPRRLARRYLLDDPPIFSLLLRERLGLPD